VARATEHGPRAILLGLLALAAGAPSAGAEQVPAIAGGRLSWVIGDELDLVGDLWAEIAIPGAGGESFFAIDSRTAIDKASSDLAFEVRDLEYALDFGWRRRSAALGGLVAGGFVGQRGKEFADADGQPFVRYLGAGLASRPDPDRALAAGGRSVGWELALGPVLDEREVAAEAVVSGRARGLIGGRGAGAGRLELRLEVAGLVHGGRFLADVEAGPGIAFGVGAGRSASLFAHYLRSRDPLSLLADGWLVGFAYEEQPGASRGPGTGRAPDIDGRIAAGGGEGRWLGQVLLRFLSPPFLRGVRGVIVVDGNILTADDTGDLYYLYHAGLERELAGLVAGGYFYHRSNHELAEVNERVTSLNVLEAGIESRQWQALPSRDGSGAFDARVRVGHLLDSSFGRNRRWHVRGGVRVRVPGGARPLIPYLAAEAERGDVQNDAFALGLVLADRTALQLERRTDDQLMSRDRSATLLTVRWAL